LKILILQHESSSPMGTTRDWLALRNIDFTLLHLESQELPHQQDFDGLIVLGGEMNVNQEIQFPWLIKERTYIKNWMESKKPLVGLCLGGQLIAEALGATVAKHDFWEIGWCELEINHEASLPGAGKVIPGFQWHGYTFEVPPQAELIIKGKHWPNQGFVYNRNTFAFQFHPEVTLEFMLECAEVQRTSQSFSPTQQTYAQILAQKENLITVKTWYFEFLDFVFFKK